jgi:hypothetical protein
VALNFPMMTFCLFLMRSISLFYKFASPGDGWNIVFRRKGVSNHVDPRLLPIFLIIVSIFTSSGGVDLAKFVRTRFFRRFLRN